MRQDFNEVLKNLNRKELETLVKQANERLNEIKRLYIREIAKGDYSYLYATWNEDGITRQKSLGKRASKSAYPKRPKPFDFHLTQKQAQKLKESKPELVGSYELDKSDFEDFYGLPMNEDKLDRPRRIYIHRTKWEKAWLEYESQLDIRTNPFKQYGVGNLKAVSFLNRMVNEGNEIFVT